MNATATLTRRESEITELFAWGASKKEVAESLYISTRTVENHARSIYDKIGCNKVNELSAWWFCKNFHISFDLSPLKRQIISLVLLAIIVPIELQSSQNMIRPSRSVKRVESKAGRRRSEDELTYNDWEI